MSQPFLVLGLCCAGLSNWKAPNFHASLEVKFLLVLQSVSSNLIFSTSVYILNLNQMYPVILAQGTLLLSMTCLFASYLFHVGFSHKIINLIVLHYVLDIQCSVQRIVSETYQTNKYMEKCKRLFETGKKLPLLSRKSQVLFTFSGNVCVCVCVNELHFLVLFCFLPFLCQDHVLLSFYLLSPKFSPQILKICLQIHL